ncbi:hypothetical protein SK224_13470 [Microbacterium sp. BG28]|uniref:DUF6907 domain-containing protein n=1 Tax=Microbacterium sp. BG28 TaxID=3097356 RepID=UPI002A5ABB52|nr:hypothetical protein [Microbacterium sp. BG28]MDY0830137.1 hypothetical protein [Microbacterium sp. BG28]
MRDYFGGDDDELCPAWCTGDHDLSDDLRLAHRSEARSVPAVERLDDPAHNVPQATTVNLIVGLEKSAAELWVWIGPEDDAERGLTLSAESAHRLQNALGDILHTARTRRDRGGE